MAAGACGRTVAGPSPRVMPRSPDAMTTAEPNVSTALTNAGIGAGMLLLAAVVLALGGNDEETALRSLPVVDARGLATQRVGAEVLLEGRIGDHPVLESGLVALQRQQAVGVTRPGSNDIRFAWAPGPVTLPAPLVVVTPGGPVMFRNTDFAWRDPPRTAGQPSLVTAGSVRLVGFAAGDAATVRATVIDAERAEVRALEVAGGTRDAYVRSARIADGVTYVIGGFFGLLGAGLLAAGGLGLRRARPRATAAGAAG
ncbi:MAG: hypothetical protein LW722_17135, partial [Rubrivivax sp.]|nr:hypothetical protein [Rubrivivax sp.]